MKKKFLKFICSYNSDLILIRIKGFITVTPPHVLPWLNRRVYPVDAIRQCRVLGLSLFFKYTCVIHYTLVLVDLLISFFVITSSFYSIFHLKVHYKIPFPCTLSHISYFISHFYKSLFSKFLTCPLMT